MRYHDIIMRTILELPDDAIEALDRLRAERGVSRAALVREAVEAYLAAQTATDRHTAFGAWARGQDGLELQRTLRAEWEDR
jgi:metal-responsive CopG/Arc/MetJ family transcriptional regulator